MGGVCAMPMLRSNFPLWPADSRGKVPPGNGFRVTVLGRAGSFPAPGEPTTGLLVSTDTTHVLVDCGSGVLCNLLQVLSPELLDAVILTHLHPDHISDIIVLSHLLRFFVWPRQGRDDPLPLYLPGQPEERLQFLPPDEALERHYCRDGTCFSVGDIDFVLRQTSHAVYCLALRAEHNGKVFVFTGDTGPSDAVTELARNAGLLVSELSAPQTMAERAAAVGHLTPDSAAQLVMESGVKRVLMTHFVMGYDADKLVSEVREAAKNLSEATGQDVPAIEPAALLRTYPVVAGDPPGATGKPEY